MASGDLQILILGATSRIAQDYITVAARAGRRFALYARRPDAVTAFLQESQLPESWARGSIADFEEAVAAGHAEPCIALLNFVGVGDPAKAKEMGASILTATASSDNAALAYLDRAPDTRYIFLSSGAVYGSTFAAPVDAQSSAVVPINSLSAHDLYGVAKLYAEVGHRARVDRSIIDLRIFNYASPAQDIEARFFLTDIARAIRDAAVLDIRDDPMVRDYLDPQGFHDLIEACLAAPAGTNMPIDAYTKAPISKDALLALASEQFGLRYRLTPAPAIVNATGAKPNYYSNYRAAEAWGYQPRSSSAEIVSAALRALIRQD